MVDFDKMNNKENVLNTIQLTLFDIIDDIPLLDEKTNNITKELAKIFIEEMGNKHSVNELVQKFMLPEMTLQAFRVWIKNREEFAKSMGL